MPFVPGGSEVTYLRGRGAAPLSGEMFRDPSKRRRRQLAPRSPDAGLKTPSALREGSGEQMSLVLKLIIDSGE